MAEKETRPTPEALLAEATKEGRGRLKIFLGAAPGVGKTYAMLEAAKRLAGESVDVVVGIIETHGRAETEALTAGLEAIPRRRLSYRGRQLTELDLDALLTRRPKLALIDELAHTNAPESRHPKRWLDVEELLEEGIDVFTTLNVQHLESLNDVVARISGVRVRETIPDKVLELANDIELIDLPPEELIVRLRQGKVYIHDQIGRAIQNFFSKGNLTALRELALRIAADRVDAEMLAHMKGHSIAGPWPTQDRILVCVNESPVAKALIRAAKRMAERQRVPWLAVSVVTPTSETLSDKAKDAIADALRLAESLGAEVVTLNAESDVAGELIDFARTRNVSRIVVGRPRPRNLLARFTRETVAEEIIRRADNLEVTVVSGDAEESRRSAIAAPSMAPERDLRSYLWATAAVALATVISLFVDRFFPVESLLLFYLVAVLVTATRLGLWPSLFAGGLSFLVYNFLFTEPYFTFQISNRDDVLTLLLFLAIAILTGNLAARLRAQVAAQRTIARRTNNLYEFTRKIASIGASDDVIWAAVHHVASTLQCRSIILRPDSEGQLTIAGGYPPEDTLEAKDWGAAEWAWKNDEAAGWSSETLPAAEWLFLPLKTSQGRLGLLGVSFTNRSALTPDQRRLLDALVDQVAIAVERTRLAADIQESQVLSETERLRAALLSSVSHDLRTPLVSIIGAASSLLEEPAGLTAQDKHDLVEAIREEGERLNRYVQNLLDMTRISHGALQPNKQRTEITDVVGAALRQLKRELSRHKVVLDVRDGLPPIDVDPLLVEQSLVNIIDNAAKYAPAGTAITVSASPAESGLRVDVADQGPGIPLADQGRIFDMFYRVNAGDTQKAGTGLGLAIARGLIEANGGTIRAETGPGGLGTRISIWLPAEEVQPSTVLPLALPAE